MSQLGSDFWLNRSIAPDAGLVDTTLLVEPQPPGFVQYVPARRADEDSPNHV